MSHIHVMHPWCASTQQHLESIKCGTRPGPARIWIPDSKLIKYEDKHGKYEAVHAHNFGCHLGKFRNELISGHGGRSDGSITRLPHIIISDHAVSTITLFALCHRYVGYRKYINRLLFTIFSISLAPVSLKLAHLQFEMFQADNITSKLLHICEDIRQFPTCILYMIYCWKCLDW